MAFPFSAGAMYADSRWHITGVCYLVLGRLCHAACGWFGMVPSAPLLARGPAPCPETLKFLTRSLRRAGYHCHAARASRLSFLGPAVVFPGSFPPVGYIPSNKIKKNAISHGQNQMQSGVLHTRRHTADAGVQWMRLEGVLVAPSRSH